MAFPDDIIPNNASSSVITKVNPNLVLTGLSIDPPELYFGALVVGEDQLTRTFTVTNIGRKTLRIESVTLTGGEQFTLIGSAPDLLRSEESFSMSVAYMSTMPGLFTGMVAIETGEERGPYYIGLSGRVVGSLYLEESVNNVIAMVDQEAWARAQADEAEAGQRITLSASIADNINATVSAERVARVTAYQALATSTEAVVARLVAAEASITDVSESVVIGDQALANRITQVEAVMVVDTVARAAVNSEATARVTADTALASANTSLSASLNTAINNEAGARTTGDQNEANARTALGNALTTSIATVDTKATAAVNSLGVVESNYTIKVTARADGKKVVAGIGLNASVSGSVAQSEILFQANNFKWVPSADLNATPIPMMQLGVVNGTNTLVLNSSVIGDQTVAARMVVDGGITADKIDARGLSIKDAAGNIILAAGTALQNQIAPYESGATVGATASNLNVGLGSGNKLSNSGPYPGDISGFIWGFDNTGKTRQPIRASFDPWRPTGQGGVYLEFLGADSPAANTLSDINEGNNRRYSVEANKRYEASVYISSHRCDAWVNVAWFTAAGVYISKSGGNGIVDTQAQGQLSNWPRSVLFATAPANAALATIYVRSEYSGANNPYTFASMWYFDDALASQTVASPWSDSVDPTVITTATNAKAIADASAAAISNISSDSVLSKGEKASIIVEYQALAIEEADISSKADALGVSRVTYNTCIDTIQAYLGGLFPQWDDTNTDTPIDGPVFRQRFLDVHYERQLLLNAIAAKAATLANWSTVSGAGKPADNATVGATFGSNISGQITAGNVSTYIAGAAIDLAKINVASIGSLSALSATIGVLRTATSGGRMELLDNVLKVFDDSGTLRVQLGNLSL